MSRLFEGMELRDLLMDLRSVKMTRIDRIQAQALDHKLALDDDELVEAWALVRRYRRKLRELHHARERARVTCGRRALGLSAAEVSARAQQRVAAEAMQRRDLGL